MSETHTPEDGGPALCARCDYPAVRKQGHQTLCAMHYRFGQMRAGAKRAGKSVPSHQQLQSLVSPGNQCRDCGQVMQWLAIQDRVRVATLQHYRDGTYGLVCRSCNTRHAFMPGDSFRDLPAGHKYCPHCRKELPFLMFSKDNGISGPIKLKSWCKPCSSESHAKWQRSNREHYNAKQREGRANRAGR